MRSHRLPILVLILASLTTGIVITWSGINHHYDAAWYLVYARGVQAGDGFSVPITSINAPGLVGTINQWPPFYPLVLALGVGVEPYLFARLLTVGLLVVAVLLTYFIALAVMPDHRRNATIAALLALTVPAMSYDGFSFARSETLFTVLALGLLLILTRYWLGRSDVSIAPALSGAGLVTLITMTRYVGVAFAALGFGWMLLWAWSVPGKPRRWWPSVSYVLSGVPLGLYALYLRSVTGSFTGTQTTADAFTLSGIPRGISTLTQETIHGLTFFFETFGFRSDLWGLLGLVVVTVILLIWAVRRGHRLGEVWNSAHLLLVAYVAMYCVVFWILGARSDIITEETARHYVAVYPVIMVLLVSVVGRINGNPYLMGGLVGLYLLSGVFAMRVPAAGLNYNRLDWRTDPLLLSLPERLPDETLVHTQYTPHLSMLLGPEVPIRTFGSIDAFTGFACDDLIYPEPYTHAAFTLIDSLYLRDTPSPQIERFMREWAAPCGEVVDYEENGFAMLLVVHLDR
jgi:hypothetical protein